MSSGDAAAAPPASAWPVEVKRFLLQEYIRETVGALYKNDPAALYRHLCCAVMRGRRYRRADGSTFSLPFAASESACYAVLRDLHSGTVTRASL